MKTALTQKRQVYIDYIRVFSMSLVIILHCICDYYNDMTNSGKALWIVLGYVNELCRTGVPLFFMISGYLLLKDDITDIKSFYKRRFLKIGIPFIIYDVFYYFFFGLINGNDLSLLGFINEFLNNGSAYHLWFIYSILFLYLMIPFINIIVRKISFKMLILLFVIVIFQGTLKPFFNLVTNGQVYMYLTDDGIVGYLGYMLLGYILGNFSPSKYVKAAIYVTASLFFVIIPIVSMNYAIANWNFLFHGGYSLNHYIEAAAIFILFKDKLNKTGGMISNLSALTFSAYFIHVFIIELLKLIHWNVMPSVMIALFIVITLTLSFLWGFAEKKITNIFKKDCSA